MAGPATISNSGLFAAPREDWLALHNEEIIDPARAIVDPHHHLWDRGGERYLIEEMAADIATGHNVVATVYVDCRSMYRAQAPEAFRPVGEVEFANGIAAMSASGGYGPAAICAGIVGHVNLLLGEAARAVLEAEIAASGQRFRGIRHSSAWDADANVAGMYATRPKGLLLDSDSGPALATHASGTGAPSGSQLRNGIRAIWMSRMPALSAQQTKAIKAVKKVGDTPSPIAVTPWTDPRDPMFLDANYAHLQWPIAASWQLLRDSQVTDRTGEQQAITFVRMSAAQGFHFVRQLGSLQRQRPQWQPCLRANE